MGNPESPHLRFVARRVFVWHRLRLCAIQSLRIADRQRTENQTDPRSAGWPFRCL